MPTPFVMEMPLIVVAPPPSPPPDPPSVGTELLELDSDALLAEELEELLEELESLEELDELEELGSLEELDDELLLELEDEELEDEELEELESLEELDELELDAQAPTLSPCKRCSARSTMPISRVVPSWQMVTVGTLLELEELLEDELDELESLEELDELESLEELDDELLLELEDEELEDEELEELLLEEPDTAELKKVHTMKSPRLSNIDADLPPTLTVVPTSLAPSVRTQVMLVNGQSTAAD